jgi:hypothetical protein
MCPQGLTRVQNSAILWTRLAGQGEHK